MDGVENLYIIKYDVRGSPELQEGPDAGVRCRKQHEGTSSALWCQTSAKLQRKCCNGWKLWCYIAAYKWGDQAKAHATKSGACAPTKA